MKKNKEYYEDDRPLLERDPEEYNRIQNMSKEELDSELFELIISDIRELPKENQEKILESLGYDV